MHRSTCIYDNRTENKRCNEGKSHTWAIEQLAKLSLETIFTQAGGIVTCSMGRTLRLTAGVRVAGVTLAYVGERFSFVAMDTGSFTGLPHGERAVHAARREVVCAIAGTWGKRW